MNENLGIFISCVLYMFIEESETVKVLKPEIEKLSDNGVSQGFFFGAGNSNSDNGTRAVDATVFRTLNKYYCSLDSIIEGSHLIVYGVDGWTFPVQDVNLTLRYPPENRGGQHIDFIFDGESMTVDDKDYIITGFKVVLVIDGPSSEGFIIDGGVLKDSISLSFVSSQLTLLRYEFWLYGVRNDTHSDVDIYSHYSLC